MPSKGVRDFARACEYWKKFFGLEDYTFAFEVLSDEDAKVKEAVEDHEEESDFSIAVTTETSTEYKTAKIKVRGSLFDGLEASEISERACHEVLHVFLTPMTNVSWEMLYDLDKKKRSVYEKWRRYESEETVSTLAGILCDRVGK
jgi:predicted nucleotidyltransferase